jgi:hypothetical protein
MKIKNLLFLLFILISIPVYSQQKKPLLTKNVITIGKNHLNASHIEAIELLFPNRVYRSNLDTSTNIPTMMIKMDIF